MKQLILCSQSARRKKIFTDLNLSYSIQTPNIDESEDSNEKPLDYLKRISIKKVLSICNTVPNKEATFVSSDTIVTFEDKILHKPENLEEAIRILSKLSGKIHYVHSSFYIFQKETVEIFNYDSTKVYFKSWSLNQIHNYINLFQPFDKAGSYGIQDKDGPVDKFEGSYTNVLGFPIRKFFQEIQYWKEFIIV
ncbi:MAG: Maf family protein [Leptospiraceae bacterium]|jgi:septum formation protein|nr:Maf family protein [Leptospiraceae bacterium]MCZ8345077.1 Maf family protein [Leptospiraceae bacterium]